MIPRTGEYSLTSFHCRFPLLKVTILYKQCERNIESVYAVCAVCVRIQHRKETTFTLYIDVNKKVLSQLLSLGNGIYSVLIFRDTTIPVVRKLQLKSSMVRCFYGDDISAEIRSQQQAESLNDIGSLWLASGQAELSKLLIGPQHHQLGTKHNSSRKQKWIDNHKHLQNGSS